MSALCATIAVVLRFAAKISTLGRHVLVPCYNTKKSTVSPDLGCLAKACDFLAFLLLPSPVQQSFCETLVRQKKKEKRARGGRGVLLKAFPSVVHFFSAYEATLNAPPLRCLYQHNKTVRRTLLQGAQGPIRGILLLFPSHLKECTIAAQQVADSFVSQGGNNPSGSPCVCLSLWPLPLCSTRGMGIGTRKRKR